MNRNGGIFLSLAVSLASLCAVSPRAYATDVDGPDDCTKIVMWDFGDASEGIFAYPVGAPTVIGAFPTCLADGPVGTQDIVAECTPRSTPPGPAGYVKHVYSGGVGNPTFWLGCYPIGKASFQGIDSESDGKVNVAPLATSACSNSPGLTDCLDPFEGGFYQDECYGDGSDAGVSGKVVFVACGMGTAFVYSLTSLRCGPEPPFKSPLPYYINILVDWNKDGDWNDNFLCPDNRCVYEWAVKNELSMTDPGCLSLSTPAIPSGPFAEQNVWMRITISSDPVSDDFPWAGSVTPSGDELRAGETEDYLVDVVENPTPVRHETWGSIKALYR